MVYAELAVMGFDLLRDLFNATQNETVPGQLLKRDAKRFLAG